jgi:peptidoglycan/xylan/chitin deacetylase (PgdA/CDA1 family)
MNPPDNRAISALFRVFGEDESPIIADATELTPLGGMNRQEALVLAILIPATALIGIGEALIHVLDPLLGCLLALPATFFFLQLKPFLLGAKSQTVQWRLWLTLCVAWAICRCHAGGIVGMFASIWIAIGIISLAAKLVLIWQASMKWSGNLGTLWRFLILLIPHAAAIAIGIQFGWPWGLLCGAATAVFFCEAVLNPYSQTLGPVVCKTNTPNILITIDDGPDLHDTPRILDLLDSYNTKAIFFMIGEKVRAHPELAREVIRRGHEIGNHTFSHPQAGFWCAGPWRTHREIAECQAVIEEVTGIKPRWFRAPVGHRNLFTHPVASAHGLQVMAWNRRGFDAVEKNPATVLARILPNLSNGDILLLHEATPIATEVLENVLKKITESNVLQSSAPHQRIHPR